MLLLFWGSQDNNAVTKICSRRGIGAAVESVLGFSGVDGVNVNGCLGKQAVVIVDQGQVCVVGGECIHE